MGAAPVLAQTSSALAEKMEKKDDGMRRHEGREERARLLRPRPRRRLAALRRSAT